MTGTDYGRLFGAVSNDTKDITDTDIAKDEANGGDSTQGLTAPASKDSLQGEKGQELTVPAEVEENSEIKGERDEGDKGENKNAKKEQSPEENARYAAARRKAETERDMAVKRARAEAKDEADRLIADAFKTMGLANPYTGKPITTREEYEAYREDFSRLKKEEFLKKSGMTERELNSFVSGLPEVKAARAQIEIATMAKKEADRAAAKSKVEAEIREISLLDPTVHELADLTKKPNYSEFYGLVKGGKSLLEAFKLANFDTLTQNAATSARQAAKNAADSKQHMTATKTRGAGAVSVPADIKANYRMMVPDATDAEIAAHYRKTHR